MIDRKDFSTKDDISNVMAKHFENKVKKISDKINFKPVYIYSLFKDNLLDEVIYGNNSDVIFELDEVRYSSDYRETIKAINIIYDKNLISKDLRDQLIKNYIVEKIADQFSSKLRKYLLKVLDKDDLYE